MDTNLDNDCVQMDPAEYEKLYQFVDAKKFHQLSDAIEKTGGKPLNNFFHDWFCAHLFLNAIKTSGGLPKAGMKFLRQSIRRLEKII